MEATVRLRKTRKEFGEALRDAFDERGFKSTRQAGSVVGIDHTLLSRMLRGEVPSEATVMRWAVRTGDSINKWFLLAGYEPVEGADDPQEADQPQPPTPVVQIQGPEVPEAIQAAIAAADTREEKVNVAFAYLKSLPNVRFGARAGDTTAGRIGIIRQYERMTGTQILPPEVI